MQVRDHHTFTEVCIPQRTPEWLAFRAGKITGSNFGSALGVSPYKSPRGLQADIEKQKDFRGNAFTHHGSSWEAYAIAQYEQVQNMRNVDMGFAIPKKLPFIGVSPDGLPVCKDTGAGGVLLEVKCPATRVSYDGVPEHYMAQIQGAMAVLRLRECHFVVFRPRAYRLKEGTTRLGPSELAFGAHPQSVGYDLAPCNLYKGYEELGNMDPDDLSRLESVGTFEVWRVASSREYQVALFKGLRWFWGKVVSGEEIPTPGKGGINPHRAALMTAPLEVTLDAAYTEDGGGKWMKVK